MREMVVVVAALGLASCADAPIDRAAVKAAEVKYVSCLDTQAAALDDGHSDAASVGYAVAGACSALAVQMVDIGTPNLSRLDQQTVERRVAGNISTATEVVLTRRRGLRHEGGAS